MSYLDMSTGQVVANSAADQKQAFFRRTYLHVAGAIAAFALLESYLISLGWGDKFSSLLATSSYSWLIVMAAYMGISMLADKWARSDYSRELQYIGLGVYVVAFAIISLPLLTMAQRIAPGVIENAAVLTGGLVAGITLFAFITRKDFSFMGSALAIGGMIVLAVIVSSILFGFQLGTFFSAAMMVFAAASILYTTSNIIHVYRPEQHVAASLALFSSIGLLFWYAVQFLMSFGGGD